MSPRRLAVAGLLLLAGCSPSQAPSPTLPTTMAPAGAPTPATLTAAAGPATPTAAPSPATPAAAPSLSPSADYVKDPRGDATSGPDLTRVQLNEAERKLTVTWEPSQPLPRTGDVGLFVSVASSDWAHSGQLGVKFQNGKQIAHLVWLDGQTINLTSGTTMDSATTVTAAFPTTALQPLGSTFTWRATSTSGAQDSDAAPDKGAARFPND